jgi:hypothetical protein
VNLWLLTKSPISRGLEIFTEILLWWFQDFHKTSISNMLMTSSPIKLERSIPNIVFASNQSLTSIILEQDSLTLQEATNTVISQSTATIITILPLSTCRNSWMHAWKIWKGSKQADCFPSSILLMLKVKKIFQWWINVTKIFKAGLDGSIPSKKSIYLDSGNRNITCTLYCMTKTGKLAHIFRN